MKLFHKKQVEEQNISEPESKPLITKLDYSIELVTVISTAEYMIVRVKVKIPFSDDDNFNVVAKNEAGEIISKQSVFMGKSNSSAQVNQQPVFKSFIYSVFVPYLSSDVIFSIVNKDDAIHEQKFEKSRIESMRAQKDAILYKNACDDPFYQEWFNSQKVTKTELDLQRKAQFEVKPKFSIVIPLYKTPVNLFSELVDSVKSQSYENWELILVNASPENEDLSVAVKDNCKKDDRIRVVELAENEGITLNTAHGIDVATGDFVCFMDHDDLIEPNCLFEYANAISDNPEADLLYCDEDKLFPDGHLGDVFFKPEFSLHLLRSCNYICHMLCIKRNLLKELNYKQAEFDGAQDHHLTLQAIEKTKNICHISKVLYHWRIVEGSTAGSSESKPYARKSIVKAVSSHLKRQGIDADVSLDENINFTTRVIYDVPKNNPKVSIIIPTHDNVEVLKKCVSSIQKLTTYNNYEVILVENNSKQQETFDYYKSLEADEHIHLEVRNTPPNIAEYNNFGRSKAAGDYLVLLNNDTEIITPSWLEIMLGICSQPEVGMVGAKLLYPDDTVQHGGVFVGNEPMHYFLDLPNHALNYFNYLDRQREVSALTTACVMTKASIYDEVLGFDENLPFDYNDIDYSFKVRKKGYLNVYTPFVELYHYESASRGGDSNGKTLSDYMYAKSYLGVNWPEALGYADAYASPNIRQDFLGSYFNF